MTHDKSSRTGFTFVELVSSLCLISLLMALLMPVFMGARERARQTTCRSNLQEIGEAVHLYAQDYDGHLPPEDHDLEAAMPYVKNRLVFDCPSEPSDLKRRFRSGEELAGPDHRQVLASSYRYRGGMANDDPPDFLLAADWGAWHNGDLDVLRLDGSVREMPRAAAAAIGREGRPVPP